MTGQVNTMIEYRADRALGIVVSVRPRNRVLEEAWLDTW